MIVTTDVSKKRAKKTDSEKNEIKVESHVKSSVETSHEPFVTAKEKTPKRKFVTKKRKVEGKVYEKSLERKHVQ